MNLSSIALLEIRHLDYRHREAPKGLWRSSP